MRPTRLSKSLVLCVSLIFLTGFQALADAPPTYYQFHPMSVMSLGYGFSLEDLTEPKARCVEFDPDPLDPGALLSEGFIYFVTNAEQLRNALSVDASVDVSYLVYKAGSHYSYSQENLFATSDVTLVIRFTTEYGRVGIKNERLTANAQSLLTQGKLAEFKKECGTRLVRIEHLGASAGVIVTLHQVDSTTKSQISAGLSGGVDLTAISGTVKATLTREMSQANSEKRLSVQILSTGGEGFGGLTDLIKALQGVSGTDIFNGIISALGDYMKQFSKANAAPIGFSIGVMTGWSGAYDDLWNLQKIQLLGVLVDEYRRDDADLYDMQQIIAGADPRSQVYSPSEMDQIRNSVAPLRMYMEAVTLTHEKCKLASTNDLKVCDMPSGKPVLPIFFGPIIAPFGGFIVVVDGDRWTGLQSRAVFEDPGGGTLLERVQRRKPGAQSAQRLFVANGKLLDSALLVGTDTEIYQVLVFYPTVSGGSTAFDGPDHMDLTVDDPGTADISPLRAIRAFAVHYQCTHTDPNHTAHLYAGQADVYLRARDIFGQTQTFKLAAGKYTVRLALPATWNGQAFAVPVTGEAGWSAEYPLTGPCPTTFRQYYEQVPGRMNPLP
jgi:hypothetical protein